MELITKKGNDSFTPFEITLKVETLGEARLLWHVFNRGNLKEAIFKGYPNNGYKDCDRHFSKHDFEIREFIEHKIKPEVI